MALRRSDGEFTAREAGPGDIGVDGFLSLPNRVSQIDESGFIRHEQHVRPNDLLLAIKGAVGAVCLAPDGVPAVEERTIWTAGQSFMIIRIRKNSPVSPVVLAAFLSERARSELPPVDRLRHHHPGVKHQ